MRAFPNLLLACAALASPRLAAAPPVYERDIAPIFRTYCAGCHHAGDAENGFSVETYRELRAGGADHGNPIQPGAPEASFLIRSLEGRVRPHMPPKDEPQPPASDLARLKEWIAAGAPGPKRDVSILQQLVVPEIKVARGLRPPVTAAAYSPDGKRLAVATPAGVEIRATPGGRARKTLTGLPGKVNAVHFSADGRHVVGAGGIPGLRGVALLWDMETGRPLREFGGHADALYDAELSPDGTILATAGYDRVIRLWHAGDARLLHSLTVHNGAVFDLAFDPSGTVLASASADQTVKLWRVSDGARLDTLNQPQGELNAVTFTPDGRHILAAGADKRIHLWRFVSKGEPALNPVAQSRFAHEAAITAFALSADGRHLLTAAADRAIKLWSLPDLTQQFAYENQPDIAAGLVFRPGRPEFLAARMNGTIELLRTRSQSESQTVARQDRTMTESPPAASPSATPAQLAEVEPNHLPAQAQRVDWPAEIKGSIHRAGDADLFRFHARAGQEMTLAIRAAQDNSPLDSRLEILTAEGRPVEQAVLQAVRDSWFTFRGKDSETSDDFRLHNWAEMELNEYLYANGEVIRLWLYPRGPDSGFKVYPGEGKRHTAFSTTALTHALNEPCYVVQPFPAGTQPVPNGLPVFRLNYENDDDPTRRAGADSLLLFTAPATGEYVVRVTDVRGFGGEDFHYTLTVRERRPDFAVTVEGRNPKVSPGSGREIMFVARRFEGFDGPIRIEAARLPPGFTLSTPVEIEAGQIRAIATLRAETGASAPDEAADQSVQLTAFAEMGGASVTRDLGTLGDIQLGPPPKVTVEILPGQDRSFVKELPGQPLEFTIRPGQTIAARVRATRHDFKDRIELGNEDSGRNLPHGLYVDNIGLNGLLIVEGQTERDFFITAAKMARPGTRTFHLRATADGGQASAPAIIRVLPADDTTRVAQR